MFDSEAGQGAQPGYPPLGFPPPSAGLHDVANGHLDPPSSPNPQCSVRGCSNPVEPPNPHVIGIMKMCAACREKHRSYASAKRARRKAEKALLTRISSTGPTQPQDLESVALPNQEPTPAVEHTSLSTPPLNPHFAIDPVLFSQPSSSSLCGALTLQAPKRTPPSVSAPPILHTASSSISAGLADQGPRAQFGSTVAHNQVQPGGQLDSGPSNPGLSHPPEALRELPFVSNDHPRYCTVKGCKAVILESIESYPFKMCQPCRNRYRIYGITKRAKWKAEREAYDRELDGLREKEDIRRAETGLPPLAESEEELRAWELSIVNGQLHQAGTSISTTSLDNAYLPKTPAHVMLPTRICTVSHCHKVLLGSYRYKHCEAHRIQNRRHSRLKRGREKVDKGFMLPDGTPLVTPGPIKIKTVTEKTSAEKQDATTEESALESAPAPSVEGGAKSPENETVSEKQQKTSKHPKPSPYTCAQDDCCNLILPGVRWRTCEICRANTRAERREVKAAAKESEGPVNPANPAVEPPPPKPPNEPFFGVFKSVGSSTPIVPIDVATSASAPVTSTSTLLTVDEPPHDPTPNANTVNNPGGVRPVRKYRKYSRYDNDPPSASMTSEAPPPPLEPHPSAYPYGPYPYHYPPPYPGYYGMPPSAASASSAGQPPLIPPPYPYPPPPGASSADGHPPWPFPYPYYPYPPPGYGGPYSHRPYPPPPGVLPPADRPTSASIPAIEPAAAAPLSVPPGAGAPASAPAPSSVPTFGNPEWVNRLYYTREDRAHNQIRPRKRKRAGEGVFKVFPPLGMDAQAMNGNTPPVTPQTAPVPAPPAPAPTFSPAPARAPTPAPVPELEPASMAVDVHIGEPPQPTPEPPVKLSVRTCASKTCNRTLPAVRVAATGGPSLPLCEKCSNKMKKRQALRKQRFKLEPKKITMAVKT